LIGNWLRHTSPKSAFRVSLIKKLISLIQNSSISSHLRLRLLSIFALANDNSGSLFLKQMLNSSDENSKTLAALSSAIFTPDDKIIPDLINALNTSNLHLQKSLCLALSSFDNELALHTLGKMLLSGEESIRKLIAENMAAKPSEGYEILKDAMTLDDILVRRSALFGLIRINEQWAFDIIEKTSIEDSQWVVRDVAAQALESFTREENKPIPEKFKPYYEDAWLIEYASTLQQGLSPDSPPTAVIYQALKDKETINTLNALTFVPRYFDESYYPEIYQAVFSKDKETSEYAASVLYSLICSGKNNPSPHQFGLF
jgi:HEAT repeat protein